MLPADVPAEPWRNGRGVTRTLARGSGWRVSLADIAGDAPFSAFPGIDRVLAVIGDEPLTLRIDAVTHALAPGSHVAFPGETVVSATSVSRTARVLNLMTERATIHAVFDADPDTPWDLLLVLTGTARAGSLRLPPGTVVTAPGAAAGLDPHGARLAAVRLVPAADHAPNPHASAEPA